MKLIEKPFDGIEQSEIDTRKWSGQTSFIFHLWIADTCSDSHTHRDTHEQSV